MLRRLRRGPHRALPATRILIRGADVTIHGSTAATSWRRGEVRFAAPPTADWPWWEGPRQCLFVTVGDDATLIVDCDRFAPDVFRALVRHLRNFEAIGDAAPAEMAGATARLVH